MEQSGIDWTIDRKSLDCAYYFIAWGIFVRPYYIAHIGMSTYNNEQCGEGHARSLITVKVETRGVLWAF